MSSLFSIHCNLCDETGPTLRRGAGGPSLRDLDAWSAFLIEHEWHDLHLWHNGRPHSQCVCDGELAALEDVAEIIEHFDPRDFEEVPRPVGPGDGPVTAPPHDASAQRWQWAGEVRLPRKGDYYLNTAIQQVVQASFDFHPAANEHDRHEWNAFPIMVPL